MKLQMILIGIVLAISQLSVAAGDAKRGKALHSENCISCHANAFGGDGTAIYTRPDRKIESYEGLETQVTRCKTALDVAWPQDQIDDVVTYLNETFYKFKQ
jgi:mono/diheme cytochrome c family protein